MVAAIDSCPKCGAPRGKVAHCARCGLSVEHMAAYAERRDASVPPAVATGWERAVETWDDQARHDALFGLVAQHGAYAWSAARYRDRQRAHGSDPVSERELARLRRAIEATLLATASSRADKTPTPYRAFLAVLLILAFAVAAALGLAMVLRKQPAEGGAIPAPHPAAPAASPGSR